MSNSNNTNDVSEHELYNRWRSLCVDKLKDKLELNVAKRKKNFQDVVTGAAHKILRDNTLQIVSNPPDFRISSTITTEAYDRMCSTIQGWPGVHLSQCKKLPPIFKKYWRIADNWWNRQKGKWFGDMFFWPILNYSLHQYCKKILINKENKVQFDYLFYIFLFDILHSKVSFKKARPNPLIFDLALEKSPKLQQWFSIAGEQHGVPSEISNKTTKKSIKDCVQSWVSTVKARKFSLYVQFQSVNDADISNYLNVGPGMGSEHKIKIKRNSDSHKSSHSFSSNNSKDMDSDNSQILDSDKDETPTNTHRKSDTEFLKLQQQCTQLKQALAAHQHQQQAMATLISEMQMNQYMKDQYIAQQHLYNQQINDAQIIQAMQELEQMQNSNSAYIKQEPLYYDNSINQPHFLPQPPRYSYTHQSNTSMTNATPEPVNILPPPLTTPAGKERRQSYADVLQHFGQTKDLKPESASVHTNHSTLTTASHTTVVSNRNTLQRQQTPNTVASTPSTSDIHSYYGQVAPVGGLPSLQIYNPQLYYGSGHNVGVRHPYHLPPPSLPPTVPKISNNLLPPPPRRDSHISHISNNSHGSHQSGNSYGNVTPTNVSSVSRTHSQNNSLEMLNSAFVGNEGMENNYVPFDTDMCDVNMDSILQNFGGMSGGGLSGSNLGLGAMMSGSNLSLNNNFGFSDSNPMNSITNMSVSYNGGMSVSNMDNDTQ